MVWAEAAEERLAYEEKEVSAILCYIDCVSWMSTELRVIVVCYFIVIITVITLEKTRIAGYCAISTECSDHRLKKFKNVFFFKWCRFFLHVMIKSSEQKIDFRHI